MTISFIPKLCNILGTLVVIGIILLFLPSALPKMFGLNLFRVETASMTPTCPVGSVVYVQDVLVESLTEGDIITYRLGTDTDFVLTHRIVEIKDNGFITKGDANVSRDAEVVRKDRVIGKVIFTLPQYGNIVKVLETNQGKLFLIIVFLGVIILWLAGAVISKIPIMKVDKIILIRVISVIIMIGSGIYIFNIISNYLEATNEYSNLYKKAEEIELDAIKFNENLRMNNSDEEVEKAFEFVSQLQEGNEDTIGWICFDTLDINYPIMQGEDNDFYLKHTYEKKNNSSGSIFMEAINHSDFSDSHTIIYGHNMKNLSMFGKLRYYKTEGFYEEHKYFTIITKNQILRYEIFAYYDVPARSDVYTIWYTPDDNFQDFIDKILSQAYDKSEVAVNTSDKIITLSTCSSEENRFVVHAKLVQ